MIERTRVARNSATGGPALAHGPQIDAGTGVDEDREVASADAFAPDDTPDRVWGEMVSGGAGVAFLALLLFRRKAARTQ